jgi:undecaprenyl-diphosphatase
LDFFQIFILSVVQGVTEFLPISSSAHLILVPVLTGWQDQGLAFDVAVHAGTLVAVLWYMRAQIARMTLAWVGSMAGRPHRDAQLAWLVLLATLPVALAGFGLKDLIEGPLRLPVVIAVSTIVFGLLLWWADYFGKRSRDEYTLTVRDALIVGLAQTLALIPGTSRAGITMTAALMLGLQREAAARFSFLLSIPTIVAAGTLMTVDLLRSAVPIQWDVLLTGFVLSAVSAYVCVLLFMRLIERTGMLPYVGYRLVLGTVLLIMFWW